MAVYCRECDARLWSREYQQKKLCPECAGDLETEPVTDLETLFDSVTKTDAERAREQIRAFIRGARDA